MFKESDHLLPSSGDTLVDYPFQKGLALVEMLSEAVTTDAQRIQTEVSEPESVHCWKDVRRAPSVTYRTIINRRKATGSHDWNKLNSYAALIRDLIGTKFL